MVIMIVFLSLTVVFVIGTVIYMNYKNRNDNFGIKQNVNEEKNEKTKNNNKKRLVDILQIKIKNNIICVGNRYSKIIRLGNIDYNMLSDTEQESIESILIQTALGIDYPIQFFSTTEFIDTSQVIELMRENRSQNSNIQEYQDYLIEYLKSLMENRTISVIKNYAIISYDGLYENAIVELNRKSLSFKGNLLRAKIECEILNEDEIYNLIYRELNKNSALNISNLSKGGNLYVDKKQRTKRNRYF